MYVGPGNAFEVRSNNTQGNSPAYLAQERQRIATAAAAMAGGGPAHVSVVQEAGPNRWGGAPVPGFPNLQQGVFPGAGRRGSVYWVHQTPPPGPSGTVPTRNSQIMMSTQPINPSEIPNPTAATQRAALVGQTDHGTFGSVHLTSGAPPVSTFQAQQFFQAMDAMTPAGQPVVMAGDFNHSPAQSAVAAAATVPPVGAMPTSYRPTGATHQSGSNLDGVWANRVSPAPQHHPSMTGDHMPMDWRSNT